MSFKEISVSELSFNPFDKIGKQWMLITAGDEKGYNTMTASWGFMGVMWGKNVIETVIRHSRYTLEFVEKSEFFTVSFYPESQREALKFCGTHSGRDCDKADESGLTPYFVDGTTAFEQAEMIFVCRRIFSPHRVKSCLRSRFTWRRRACSSSMGCPPAIQTVSSTISRPSPA